MLRIGVTLITFTLGVGVATVYRLISPESTSIPVVATAETPFAPSTTACYPGRSIKVRVTDRSSYFPTSGPCQNEWQGEFRDNWYSKHLRAMNEAPLHAPDDSGLESYRFLWLRSFHHPVAVRIWNSGSKQFISVKETNGAGGYDPGRIIVNETKELTAHEWSEFIRLLDASCYWQLPTFDDEISGTDGAQWVLEGVKGGRYHIVDRWSPRSGDYREACLYVLKLSGLNLDFSSETIY